MMAWQICSNTRSVIATMSAALRPCMKDAFLPGITNSFMGSLRNRPCSSKENLAEANDPRLELQPSLMEDSVSRLDASSSPLKLTDEHVGCKVQHISNTNGSVDLFNELRRRFLSFKKLKFLGEADHFQALAAEQAPKFMVIACADSRVCPSNVLGFQPGEAFMIRNVANLVPPLENGPTETNAALEFAVNTLKVEKILVIGHSSCAGIQTLMNVQDDCNSSFVKQWVAKAKAAKLRTKSDASHLSFNQQCRHCEKESINLSLLNLLTYPWIQERVRKELLSIHGGYYDFLNCTFEKWTLDFKESSSGQDPKFSVKDEARWS